MSMITNKSRPKTLTLDRLRQIAKRKGRNRAAARYALTTAETLARAGLLGSIVIDRELRKIEVYGV